MSGLRPDMEWPYQLLVNRREYEALFARVTKAERERDELRAALERLKAAALDYSPRYDHDWRCEYRTAEAGYVEGGPPVIRCECGFDELGVAIRDAQDLLQVTEGDT